MSQKHHCDACDALIEPPFLDLQRVTLVRRHDYSSATQRGGSVELCAACVRSIPEPVRKLLSFQVDSTDGRAAFIWPEIP